MASKTGQNWVMSEEFDPYRKWLGIPPKDQPPHHYRLLGLSPFEDDPDVIDNAANRQMQHVRTFQTSKYSELSQRILNELASARLCLLNPTRKSDYDKQLRKELKQKRKEKSQFANGSPPAPPLAPLPPPVPGVLEPAPQPANLQPIPVGMAVVDQPEVAPVSIRTNSSTRPATFRSRKKSSNLPIVLGLTGGAIVIGLAIVLFILGSNSASQNSQNTEFQPPERVVDVPKRKPPLTQPPPQQPNRINRPQSQSRPANPGTATTSTKITNPASAPEPTRIDYFALHAAAVRDAFAQREYHEADQFLAQAEAAKQSGNAAQDSELVRLRAIGTYLREFRAGVERAVSLQQRLGTEFEVRGDTFKIISFDQQLITFSVNGGEALSQSFREIDPQYAVAFSAHHWMGKQEATPTDKNFFPIYAAAFLTFDRIQPEQRAKQLELARQFWQEAAADGYRDEFLAKELEIAGVDLSGANVSTTPRPIAETGATTTT